MKEVPHTELEYDKIVSLVTAHVLSLFLVNLSSPTRRFNSQSVTDPYLPQSAAFPFCAPWPENTTSFRAYSRMSKKTRGWKLDL